MTQSLFTSITGMTSSQSKIDVIANNIANMNTTAFKSSNLVFSDLYSRSLSAGSAPTSSTGGTNPMQVGLGVGLAGITTDFTGGSITETGNSSDLYLSGNGWFTVKYGDGTVGLTRDGSFSLDKNGDLVTQDGLKVLGTNSVKSSVSGTSNIHIPNKLNLVTSGKDLTSGSAGDLANLNNATITTGTISFGVYDGSGNLVSTVTADASSATSLNDIASAINTAIKADTALTKDGKSTLTATVNKDGTFSLNMSDVTGLTSIGSLNFASTGNTSNFLSETNLSTATLKDNAYTSKILSYKVDIGAPTNSDATETMSSYSITETGALEVKYSNADTLTVTEKDGQMVFKYVTSEGKVIDSSDINVSDGVIDPANLQIQLGSVLNEQGLVANGGNVYVTGSNSGEISFSIGTKNGYAQIGSGGLEASNVNLSVELANMIVAQRAIDASSRVFNTSSEVLERIVSLQ